MVEELLQGILEADTYPGFLELGADTRNFAQADFVDLGRRQFGCGRSARDEGVPVRATGQGADAGRVARSWQIGLAHEGQQLAVGWRQPFAH